MKKYLLHSLLYGMAMFPLSLAGQGLDLAQAITFGGSVMATELEPAENGPRNTFGSFYSLCFEVRSGKRIGWLISVMTETITSRKSPGMAGAVAEPFNMVHPYHSSLSGSYLMLGAQYNLRIGRGDLSFGVLTGPGSVTYSRTWDVLNARVLNDKIDTESLSFASDVDISRSTWRLSSTARVQYTYWFSRALAFSVGAEYNQSNYLSGGVDTGRGLRYELNQREFLPGEVTGRTTPLLYNVNYDRTTLVPDPDKVIRQLRFSIGVIGKFNAS